MNVWTRIFLVLLRLAIGVHFLVEGIEKVESILKGPTATSKPFTSEGYLKEATGPLGDFFRHEIGDDDETATARLRLDNDGHISPALRERWDELEKRFVEHYRLDDSQEHEAQARLEGAKAKAADWLAHGVSDVDKPLGGSTVKVEESVPDRIKEYEQKLKFLRDMQTNLLKAFDKDVAKQKLREAKAEVARLRSGLLSELDQHLLEPLQNLLTSEQKAKGPPPSASPDHWWPTTRLEWIDQSTSWGLVAIGVGLLIGLFTRTACVSGAVFLAMIYLTTPPFPWLPQPPVTEGHYFFVNKTLIEMLALLALATTTSGRWLGVDGLLRCLNPFRWRSHRN